MARALGICLALSAVSVSRSYAIGDGRVLALKSEWSDGTTALLFEPVELLERLAALTPRPRINLVLHHGVLSAAPASF
jgi:Putative transposase